MREMIDTLGDYGTPWLYGYSPQVLPKPPDWQIISTSQAIGFWTLNRIGNRLRSCCAFWRAARRRYMSLCSMTTKTRNV